jgi:hypothetical protein
MTQDEIIAMLRASCEKDRVDPEQNGFWVIHTDELVAFAKLVAQHEREACAKEAETLGVHPALNVFAGGPDWYKHGKEIAAAIRARGQA